MALTSTAQTFYSFIFMFFYKGENVQATVTSIFFFRALEFILVFLSEVTKGQKDLTIAAGKVATNSNVYEFFKPNFITQIFCVILVLTTKMP